MTLESRLVLLAQAIGADVKTITDAQGVLSTLTTAEKSNLVGSINELDAARGSLASLTTTAQGDVVTSINEIDAEVGVLSTLTTTAKGTVVSSINELDAEVGVLSTLTTTEKGTVVGSINELDAARGSLAALTTTAKNNIVAAINEMNDAFTDRLNDASADNSTTEVWSANKITSYISANASSSVEAVSDPTSANDVASGYHVGQTWVNTSSDRTFVMVDGTTSSAVWSELTVINDASATSSTSDVWSADKITAVVEQAKTDVTNSLVDGAAGALDTLNELADALGNDANFSTTILDMLATRLNFDAVQVLTAPQKVQGCANLGAVSIVDLGNSDANFTDTYTTAKA
jgi:hypothetical protein